MLDNYEMWLIEMLSKKEKSRINFLIRKQKESDDDMDDFIDHLKHAHHYWIDRYIKANSDVIIGAGPKSIPIPHFKNNIYYGFIGKSQLELMREEIKKLIHRFIKTKPNVPKTFEEMFDNDDIAKKCFEVLKIIEPRIIDDKNQYCLGEREKGAITAYVIGLKNGFISKYSDKTLASILNAKIKGLDLGAEGRTLRNTESTAYKKYYNKILYLLNDTKLPTNGK
jgi:hypothetical protein